MKRKRTYQAVRVQQVRVEELLPLLVAGCIVALDVAKMKMLVALATVAGEVVKLFRFEHPTETAEFLRIVRAVREGVGPGMVKAAMEPTGTYGDAVRHQLVAAGVSVWMVSPKRTHDSQELFDSVPSLHDPKSAVLIAKLHSMGLSTEWKPAPAMRSRLRALVELRQHEQRREEMCHGRMEAMLARHWPEVGRWLDVREQRSALRLLVSYPSPALVNAAPDGARALLREASRGRLSAEAIEGVIADTRTTVGVPMVPEEECLVRTLATQVLEAAQCADVHERAMQGLAKDDEVFSRLAPWMGTYTAAVIVTMCNPRQYMTARQLEKACGLNLREKSSGEHTGRLSITKRGPGVVRHVLYMFTLRMLQESAVVRAWYRGRRGYTEESKQRAVVAVMRKLVRAAFHVANGNEFDASKLFDVRRLDLRAPNTEASASVSKEMTTAALTEMSTPASNNAVTTVPKNASASVAKRVIARTTPRPTARGRKRAATSTKTTSNASAPKEESALKAAGSPASKDVSASASTAATAAAQTAASTAASMAASTAAASTAAASTAAASTAAASTAAASTAAASTAAASTASTDTGTSASRAAITAAPKEESTSAAKRSRSPRASISTVRISIASALKEVSTSASKGANAHAAPRPMASRTKPAQPREGTQASK